MDDVLLEVLDRLDSGNRRAVSGCCRRLRSLAFGGFTRVSINVPATGCEAATHAGTCMSAMTSVELMLPDPATQKDADAEAALDLFLASALPSVDAPAPLLAVETIRIRSALQQTQPGSSSRCRRASGQVSARALSRLTAAAPRLQRLSLPTLSAAAAAAALPLLPATLRSLSLTVSDSPSLSHVVAIKGLMHLALSTCEGLLYLVMSQVGAPGGVIMCRGDGGNADQHLKSASCEFAVLDHARCRARSPSSPAARRGCAPCLCTMCCSATAAWPLTRSRR